MTHRTLIGAGLYLALSAGLCAGPALAATQPAASSPTVILKVTPELMLKIVQGAGYTAELDSSQGNPEITLTRKGAEPIYLNLHGCKGGSCAEVDAYTYYTTDDLDTAPTDDDMKQWNKNNYTQAYIDDEDDNSVNLDSLYLFGGGFTKANFITWLTSFRTDADAFDKMLRTLKPAQTEG